MHTFMKLAPNNGSVQWIEDTDGRVVIFTTGMYRDVLMKNVHDIGQPVEEFELPNDEFNAEEFVRHVEAGLEKQGVDIVVSATGATTSTDEALGVIGRRLKRGFAKQAEDFKGVSFKDYCMPLDNDFKQPTPKPSQPQDVLIIESPRQWP